MSRSMYQDFRPALPPLAAQGTAGHPPLAWYEPRMALGMITMQPHAHNFGGHRMAGDPYDPWQFREQDGATDDLYELFDGPPSIPDSLFASPYGEVGKLAWISTRNAELPLSRAVEQADFNEVQRLLDGSDTQSVLTAAHPDTGETALHIAAATAQPNILRLLLATAGAPVDTLDRQGWTPLMYLAWHTAEPVRTRRLSASDVEASLALLLDSGADPLLRSPDTDHPELSNWHGSALDFASLAWNHTFLRALLPRLSGERPLYEEFVPPPPHHKIQGIFTHQNPRLGSRFVFKSVYPFTRARGVPRRLLISTGQPPFEAPSRAGEYSWDFTGSRLVLASASSDAESAAATLPAHPTNDDIAHANVAEWERTLDALLAGGAQVKFLAELWHTGLLTLPARVALRLLDASHVDVRADIPSHPSHITNGGSLAARLIESEVCAAYGETVPLLRGLAARGADIVGARLLPKLEQAEPRLQSPVAVYMHPVSRRATKAYTEQATARGEPEETIWAETTKIRQSVLNRPFPILALAVASLDPDLIQYLVVDLGVSKDPGKPFVWSDFMRPVTERFVQPGVETLCRHLLPGRPGTDELLSAYQERHKATCERMAALDLK